MIVAADIKGVIGCQNRLPWHLPADLQHFKETTMGKPIIMGRKTFESLPRILPQRKHIVLSRNHVVRHPHVVGCSSVEEVLEYLKEHHPNEESFVIGGSQVYELFMPYVNKIYLTRVMGTFEGDAYLPSIYGHWEITSIRRRNKDEENPYDMLFYTYERRLP